MTLFTLADLIAGLLAAIYTYYRVKRKPSLIATRANRYLTFSSFLVFVVVGLAAYGIVERSNLAFFGFYLVLYLQIYCCLCWTGLTNKPELAGRLIIRPKVASVMVVAILFQLLTFKLAGSALDRVVLGEPTEVITSFWLWLGIMFAATIYTITLLMFLFETIQAQRNVTDTLDLPGYFQKYRYTGFALIAFGNMAFFFLIWLGFLGFKLLDSPAFYEVTLHIRDWVLLGLLAVTIPQWFVDRQVFDFFERKHQKRLDLYLEQLRPLYEFLIQHFPSPFTTNAYNFCGINSTAWLINSVVKTITDIRMRLWRAEAQQHSLLKNIPIAQVGHPPKASLQNDAELFRHFLENEASISEAIELLNQIGKVAVNVPGIALPNSKNAEQLAAYYSKLAKRLKPQIGRRPVSV